MSFRLYNTMSRSVEPVVVSDPSRVTFYSCGPTVYDDAHIGNFRSFLSADVLRRWLESPLCAIGSGGDVHTGPRGVVQVMNITDVGHMTDDAAGGESGEDRMAVAGRRLLEAKKAGKLPAGVSVDPGDPYQIARFYEARFREDARALGLKVAIEAERDATLMPRATEHIKGMIGVIARLLERGHAYVSGGPGSRVVYFRVRSFDRYGCLSGNSLDRLREGEGGRVSSANQSSKEHPGDFLLWKEDARHVMKWDSPWGSGYPGWHIECSAMSAERLAGWDSGDMPVVAGSGSLIDFHSGGEDNIFPHHESENAQSCCAFCDDADAGLFARHWFHPRFLLVEGDKMSKSKGNFFTARDLFARGVEPAALRLEIIRTHYRSNANFTEQGLKDSARMVERWRAALAKAKAGGPGVAGRHSRDAEAEFARAMNDDLNVAAGVAAMNTLVSFDGQWTAGDAEVIERIDAVLGVLSLARPAATDTEIGVFKGGIEPDPRVIERLSERLAARKAKDFARSDQIRDELAGMGYAIKDVAGGKVEVTRL